jgi:DNA-binding IclR family transcriptional regulator
MENLTSGDQAHGSRRAGEIGAAANVLMLLRMFESEDEIRIGAASKRLQLSRSTIHRLFTTLLLHGFVEHRASTRSYVPGPALTAIGRSVSRSSDEDAMTGALVELAELTKETVHLAVLRGDHVLYLKSIESEYSVRTRSRVGWTLPSHSAAAGKALLSALSDEEILKIFPVEIIGGAPQRGQLRRVDLLAELELVRARGYATNNGESEPDVSAVGAVLCDPSGRPQAAIAATAPKSRADGTWMRKAGEMAAAVANRYNLRSR